MTVIHWAPKCLTLRIPSVFCYLSTALDFFRDFMGERGLQETARPMVVLQEMLTSMLNRNDSNRTLFIRIEELDSRVFKITVEEQGQALDQCDKDVCPRDVDVEIRDNYDYCLLNDLSERLEISREGSRITSFVSTAV